MQVQVNPHHTRVGSTGHGYSVRTSSRISLGVYDTPAAWECLKEAGQVTLYADQLWLILTPEEARDLADALRRHALACDGKE